MFRKLFETPIEVVKAPKSGEVQPAASHRPGSVIKPPETKSPCKHKGFEAPWWTFQAEGDDALIADSLDRSSRTSIGGLLRDRRRF